MKDEEQLGRLYRIALSELPGGRPDAALARATAGKRRRNRRRAAAAITTVAFAMILVASLPRSWLDGMVTTAEPAGAGTPVVCPALRPGTSDASADYANLLIWDGRTYLDSTYVDRRKPGKLGARVTTVTCSIAELTADNGNLVANMPWPDGTATFLPTGTPVFAIHGRKTRCELGVEDATKHNTVKLFVAVREPGWEPIC